MGRRVCTLPNARHSRKEIHFRNSLSTRMLGSASSGTHGALGRCTCACMSHQNGRPLPLLLDCDCELETQTVLRTGVVGASGPTNAHGESCLGSAGVVMLVETVPAWAQADVVESRRLLWLRPISSSFTSVRCVLSLRSTPPKSTEQGTFILCSWSTSPRNPILHTCLVVRFSIAGEGIHRQDA